MWRVRKCWVVAGEGWSRVAHLTPRMACKFAPFVATWLVVPPTQHSQDAFYEHYFESQREHIFRNVELLIYVFDIQTRDLEVLGAHWSCHTHTHCL